MRRSLLVTITSALLWIMTHPVTSLAATYFG